MDGFSKYHFKDIGKDEQIVQVLHRNWFYLIQQFFLVFVILAVFMGSTTFLPLLFPEIASGANKPVVLFAQNFFLLALWIYSFLVWVDYYFDIWIITTERIVNIEQKGMFQRKVSEMSYSKLQDISTEVTGFLPTMLNYGDVKVQTAGEEDDFIFRTVSDPYQVKNTIISLQKKSEAVSTDRLGDMIKEKIGA